MPVTLWMIPNITTLQKISLPQIIAPVYKSKMINMSVLKPTYMTVQVTVTKEAWTAIEPLTTTTSTTLRLTKIMITIWDQNIK